MGMESIGSDKIQRVLGIYTKLMNGYVINKTNLAQEYGVNERSIQRDVDDIRSFLYDTETNDGVVNNIIYDRKKKGYRLEQIYSVKLTNPEILAICKILLDSRSLTKQEMDALLAKLISCCVPAENQKRVSSIISNERFHYIQPRHGKVFLEDMWNIANAIEECRFIEFDYQGLQGHSPKHRIVKPLAIMFSEYYFYLAATLDNVDKQTFSDPNDINPTIYRIDRIQNLKVSDEHFRIPYADRFEEGEFRKRVQFMFGGPLKKVRFEYTGYSIEAVLDRLPTAVIEKEEMDPELKRIRYVVSAECYGNGIDMWMRSQGDNVVLY